ncbi:MAG: hypothetical protein AB7F32_00825 [Victivallaceae bacterium]
MVTTFSPETVNCYLIEPISKVFADDEKMIADGRRRRPLSGFTLSGKARSVGQAGRGERFSAPQRVLKLTLIV